MHHINEELSIAQAGNSIVYSWLSNLQQHMSSHSNYFIKAI